MHSQDIVILLKLVSIEQQLNEGSLAPSPRSAPFAVRNLAEALGISKTEISASLGRSAYASLAIRSSDRLRVNRRNLTEFVKHGLKYAFPVRPGAPERGLPTAFAAPMLEGRLVSSGADVYVWPHAEGRHRGPSITPLFKSVPEAALRDERLYEMLALVDAIRLGKQRETQLARSIFDQRMDRA